MSSLAASTNEPLNPPAVTEDGFLTKQSIYDFFAQLPPEKDLRARAGRLFGKMFIAATITASTIHFKVVCDDCNLDVHEPCPAKRKPHTYMEGAFSVEVESIKQYADEFIKQRLKSQAALRDDFELLLEYMSKEERT